MVQWFSRNFQTSGGQARRGAWRCAGGALLMLAACVGLNLAGCGGGGGGIGSGGGGGPTVNLTIRVRDNAGRPVGNASVQLTGTGNSLTVTTDAAGEDLIKGLSSGIYSVKVDDPNNPNDDNLPESMIIVSGGTGQSPNQTIIIVPGVTGVVGQPVGGSKAVITGRIVFSGLISPTPAPRTCPANASPITAGVLLRVRDVTGDANAPGVTYVAFLVRDAQDASTPESEKGTFRIEGLPATGATPRTFRIDVQPLFGEQGTGRGFIGTSQLFTVDQTTTTVNLSEDICAVQDVNRTNPPGPTGTPVPAPTAP